MEDISDHRVVNKGQSCKKIAPLAFVADRFVKTLNGLDIFMMMLPLQQRHTFVAAAAA